MSAAALGQHRDTRQSSALRGWERIVVDKEGMLLSGLDETSRGLPVLRKVALTCCYMRTADACRMEDTLRE